MKALTIVALFACSIVLANGRSQDRCQSRYVGDSYYCEVGSDLAVNFSESENIYYFDYGHYSGELAQTLTDTLKELGVLQDSEQTEAIVVKFRRADCDNYWINDPRRLICEAFPWQQRSTVYLLEKNSKDYRAFRPGGLGVSLISEKRDGAESYTAKLKLSYKGKTKLIEFKFSQCSQGC